jgi:ABC-type antimicrobial peptide transport system permease subunit
MVTSNEALLALHDALSKSVHTDALYAPTDAGGRYTILWSYRLNTSQIFIQNLDSLVAQLNNVQITYLNSYGPSESVTQYPYLLRASVNGPLFGSISTPGILESFQSRVSVARIPVIVLTLQIVALILFFISLLTNLLVDSQAETVALLRSRGASRLQVFGALLTQSVLLAVLAIIIGVPLSIVAVIVLAQRVLPPAEQHALNVVTQNVIQAG